MGGRVAGRRLGRLGVVLACGLGLALAVTVSASSTPAPSWHSGKAADSSWVTVFTWSGGGSGDDIRSSSTFALQGGHQRLLVSAAAVPGAEGTAAAGWTVESSDQNQYEMVNIPEMGQYDSDLYLPAGDYFISSDTVGCTWTISMSEQRVTPSPSPTPAPSLTLAIAPAVCKKGRAFTLSGTVAEFEASDLSVVLYRKTGESLLFLKRASLNVEGEFRASMRATTTGRWTCVAAYSTGGATYFARPVVVTVKR